MPRVKPAGKRIPQDDELAEWRNRCMEAMKLWMEKSKEALRGANDKMPPIPDLPPLPPLRHSGPGFRGNPEHIPPFFGPPRSNVVASRIDDEGLKVVDMLVEAGLFNTRSEAVAYLVAEGIKARKDVIDQVSAALGEIREIAKQRQERIAKLRKQIGIAGPEVSGEAPCPKDQPP